MANQKRFIVSHAPFWHDGSSVTERSYHMMLAALPAVIFGIIKYGMPALAVTALSVSSAILWEAAFRRISKASETVGDGNAALIGLIFAMLLPATSPWWVVVTGTFVAIVIGKEIFGGIGSNPFNPVAVAAAFLMLSWWKYFDFNAALVHYPFDHMAVYPLSALKNFGLSSVEGLTLADLLTGKQTGGIGTTFSLGLIIGGVYLMLRGIIRWEIALSFIAGVFITATIFKANNPEQYAGPMIHILSGYTLLGAFFLATDDSSSPVNLVPMFLYGLIGGLMVVLIRNIGAYIDGTILTILLINTVNPLLDKIRPKALGKVV